VSLALSQRREPDLTAHSGPPERVGSVLDLDPDLGAGIEQGEWQTARQASRTNLVRVPAGQWRPLAATSSDSDGILGLVLVAGVIARESALGEHRSLELLCSGDVLLLPQGASDVPIETGGVILTALCDVTLMLLGRTFLSAAARWPSLIANVHRRLEAQRQRYATQALAMHLPRSEHRVLLTLWLMAQRCGRVTPDGTVLPLEFTHECLSQMTAARRPTVTLALGSLEAQGCLLRTEEGHLVLTAQAEREVAAVAAKHHSAPIGQAMKLALKRHPPRHTLNGPPLTPSS
jgi:CRP-like cAMP-binding protein